MQRDGAEYDIEDWIRVGQSNALMVRMATDGSGRDERDGGARRNDRVFAQQLATGADGVAGEKSLELDADPGFHPQATNAESRDEQPGQARARSSIRAREDR